MIRIGKKFELINGHLIDNYSNLLGGDLGPGSDLGTGLGSSVVNIAPIANAGSNYSFSLPNSTVNLNGSLSNDPDGTINSYKWKQLNGPNTASIEKPTEAITGATNLIAGTYTFELTVTDDKGATGSAQVIITVNPATAPTGPAPIFTAIPASLSPSVTPAGTLIPGVTPSIITNPNGGVVTNGGGSFGGGFGSGGGGGSSEETTTTTTTTTKSDGDGKLFGLVSKKTAVIGSLSLLALLAIWKGPKVVKYIKGN